MTQISDQSIYAFASELQTVLGWYAFDETVNIADSRQMQGYPSFLVVVHEAAHLALTKSSLYGHILIALANVLKNSPNTDVPSFLALTSESGKGRINL